MYFQSTSDKTSHITDKPKVVFFGSFLEYSASVLHGLLDSQSQNICSINGVVTTPPKPAGRKKKLAYTAVHTFALEQNIPVFHPESLNEKSLQELPTCDYFITAGYGKLLPASWLNYPAVAALNIHFSLLPKYRGANPGEWAILAGEKQSGITAIEMAPSFDTGAIVAQATIHLSNNENRNTIYQKLYTLAGANIGEILQVDYHWRKNKVLINESNSKSISYSYPPIEQPESPTPYARRLNREDSWINWEVLLSTIQNRSSAKNTSELSNKISKINDHLFSNFLWERWVEWQKRNAQESCKKHSCLAEFIETAHRALLGFPGLWTQVQTTKGKKRLKIIDLELHKNATQCYLVLKEVQIEGQSRAQWNQVKNSILNNGLI